MKVLFALSAALAAFASHSGFSQINHPLDALDASEIAQSVALLRAAGHADDQTPILSLRLNPPPKAKVLKWNSGEAFSRQSIATIRSKRLPDPDPAAQTSRHCEATLDFASKLPNRRGMLPTP